MINFGIWQKNRNKLKNHKGWFSFKNSLKIVAKNINKNFKS